MRAGVQNCPPQDDTEDGGELTGELRPKRPNAGTYAARRDIESRLDQPVFETGRYHRICRTGRAERYAFAQQLLAAQEYARQGKKQRGAIRALPEQNDRIEPAADRAADPDVHRNRNHRAARIPAASVRQQVHRRRCGSAWHGACLACENPISAKRLQAVPWAELCLHCQERSDLAAAGVLGADHEEGVELGVG